MIKMTLESKAAIDYFIANTLANLTQRALHVDVGLSANSERVWRCSCERENEGAGRVPARAGK